MGYEKYLSTDKAQARTHWVTKATALEQDPEGPLLCPPLALIRETCGPMGQGRNEGWVSGTSKERLFSSSI